MTTISVSAVPANAECRSVLADGRILTITASRRPRANRADVKCTAPNAPSIAERMQQVVRLARHTEARFDSRDQVMLSMDIAPAADERDWELAAVLADRMVRGLQPIQPTIAQGSSDAWHLGRVDGTVQVGEGAAPVDAVRITHLGALIGHADMSAAVSTVRTWFPLHSGGINDTLGWLEVSVFPLEAAARSEEDSITAPGLELTAQQEVKQTLNAARHFDGKALGRWRTVVRFGQPRFQGGSYQLALVMADRLARGREFVPRGRIIATGCSSAWHAGRVDTVDGRESKLELIFNQVNHGDRVLLPKDWQDCLPPGFAAGLRQKGATLACIDKIGMI
ncbi:MULTISPECIES: hypothetical protein [unclassified Duganella]|jgi:hypothetical protein|uniref:hypothetical protein n=1 Tax=unclassified Duganella TaxID=2636909 RepID=UPI0008884655|nr:MULTISPECIES: hypothetical protein [unclassified Duganella]SDF63041.1 hypothetical protein SAMN05216320_101811 [Duganella sp. OV458]SDI65398.1 hypothetical protein SAMN05428973_101604 [Duganella sp. OV510]